MKESKYAEYIFKAFDTYFVGGLMGHFLLDKEITDVEKFVSAIEMCSWAQLYGIKLFTYDHDAVMASKKDDIILHVERRKYTFDDTWDIETLKKGAFVTFGKRIDGSFLREVCFAKGSQDIFIPCPTETNHDDDDCLFRWARQRKERWPHSQRLTKLFAQACQDIGMDDVWDFRIYPSRSTGHIRQYNTRNWEYALHGFPQDQSLCESTLEEMFYGAVQQNYPHIVLQYQIGAYRVDFAFPDKKIAIEVDGYYYHHTPEQLSQDAQKLRALQKMGWRLLRFTEQDITQRLSQCLEDIQGLLEQ